MSEEQQMTTQERVARRVRMAVTDLEAALNQSAEAGLIVNIRFDFVETPIRTVNVFCSQDMGRLDINIERLDYLVKL